MESWVRNMQIENLHFLKVGNYFLDGAWDILVPRSQYLIP